MRDSDPSNGSMRDSASSGVDDNFQVTIDTPTWLYPNAAPCNVQGIFNSLEERLGLDALSAALRGDNPEQTLTPLLQQISESLSLDTILQSGRSEENTSLYDALIKCNETAQRLATLDDARATFIRKIKAYEDSPDAPLQSLRIQPTSTGGVSMTASASGLKAKQAELLLKAFLEKNPRSTSMIVSIDAQSAAGLRSALGLSNRLNFEKEIVQQATQINMDVKLRRSGKVLAAATPEQLCSYHASEVELALLVNETLRNQPDRHPGRPLSSEVLLKTAQTLGESFDKATKDAQSTHKASLSAFQTVNRIAPQYNRRAHAQSNAQQNFMKTLVLLFSLEPKSEAIKAYREFKNTNQATATLLEETYSDQRGLGNALKLTQDSQGNITLAPRTQSHTPEQEGVRGAVSSAFKTVGTTLQQATRQLQRVLPGTHLGRRTVDPNSTAGLFQTMLIEANLQDLKEMAALDADASRERENQVLEKIQSIAKMLNVYDTPFIDKGTWGAGRDDAQDELKEHLKTLATKALGSDDPGNEAVIRIVNGAFSSAQNSTNERAGSMVNPMGGSENIAHEANPLVGSVSSSSP